MRKTIIIFVILITSTVTYGQTLLNGQVEVAKKEIVKEGDLVAVDLLLDLSKLEIKSNQLYELTPSFVSDSNKEELPKIQIVGRNKELFLKRNEKNPYGYRIRRKNRKSQEYHYQVVVPHQEWMNRSTFVMDEDQCGCNSVVLASAQNSITSVDLIQEFIPSLVFIKPEAEVKNRNEIGKAYLDFQVGKTHILETFRNNPTELAKVNQLFDEINKDENLTIKGIAIHGYASPEGSYSLNSKLASERAQAFKQYLTSKHHFKGYEIQVDSTPEDWEGLRKYVVNSTINDKEAILSIIDNAMDPDPKEWKLKATYPEQYRELLQNCYPALRRSEYIIDYTVRAFSVEEAKVLLKTKPQLLSLEEMYLIAQTYEVGSDEFQEVFDIAVRMYPKDPIANLNAANISLSKKNLEDAQRYLDRVEGDRAEKIHAQGVLEAMKGNLQEAKKLFEKAEQLGISEARENLEKIK
ncbi:hypothetical protein Bcop_1914 [Bacteroides coprosuis DSM 18011]|uniref:DUF3868 domain-containing protein n=1 Tax=Bacteroides coprosuis DSM 18011 TaxID=679937 RepID=F3ZS74_9BACE|nr:DUF3868 domain-containing protein [Bacteroides coprosuis]EGJ72095.1 hypothetical protein Bcop_1914 [Bacteroides coprosuis DSM 18011]